MQPPSRPASCRQAHQCQLHCALLLKGSRYSKRRTR
jgi:hypothetical protein